MSRETCSAIARRRFLGLVGAVPFAWQLSGGRGGWLGLFRRRVQLRWEWAPGAGGPVNSFEVLVGTASGSYELPAVRVPGTDRTCVVTLPVSSDGVYYMAVRAVNSSGISGPSNEVKFRARRVPGDPAVEEVS